jgi:uncharacterized protein DUF4149
MLLSLVVWIGGIIFFSFVVAPGLFMILPRHELAGQVVTYSLAGLHYIAIGAAIVFLICSLLHRRFADGRARFGVRETSIVIMLALTLVSQFAVTPRMRQLRREMVEIDIVAPTDSRRVEFNRLHQYSTSLEGGVLVLGLLTLVSVARRI